MLLLPVVYAEALILRANSQYSSCSSMITSLLTVVDRSYFDQMVHRIERQSERIKSITTDDHGRSCWRAKQIVSWYALEHQRSDVDGNWVHSARAD